MRNLILGFFVITVIFGASKTHAQCKCANVGKTAFDALKRADVVFIGEVTKIEKIGGIKVVNKEDYNATFNVTFKVSATWKTDLSETVTIRNISSSGSDFKENETYLVYAKTRGNKLNAYIGCCTRTELLSKAAKDLEEFKEKGEKPATVLKSNF